MANDFRLWTACKWAMRLMLYDWYTRSSESESESESDATPRNDSGRVRKCVPLHIGCVVFLRLPKPTAKLYHNNTKTPAQCRADVDVAVFFLCKNKKNTTENTHIHSKTAYCKTRMLLCESESSPLIELFPQSAVARTLGVTG